MSDIFGGEEIDLDVPVPEREEPVAETAPEPEPAAAVAPDIGETSTVPLAALNEARAQARMAQAQLQEMKSQMQPLMELRQRIEEAERRDREKQQEQEFNSDPLGVIQKQQAQALREIEELKRGPTQEVAQQQVFQSIASQVQEFKKTAPDYDAALAHVLEARKQELMAMGAPEYEAQQRIAAEAQDIAVNALRSGQNPGQVVYQLAKLRGFQAKQTSTKLETVGKGQAAAKSLSGASGNAPGVGLSLAELDNMSDDEFDKFWEKEIKPKNR